MTVGVENVWNRFLYSPLEFTRFLRDVNSESVKAYFDVGNILLLGFPQQWIEALGREIACIHVKDFDLKRREFTGLLKGDVPWPEVMKALREAGYDGFLNVELSPDPSDPLRAARESEAALAEILVM
ncbi:MAG: TIM barrel protein [Candidatus Bathyarchaeia archaeon]